MEPIEMIAIDLDDTLLHDDISISDYTKTVLKKAKAKGIHIVIATGRMFHAAQPWGKALGLGDVPMVVYTGAMTALCDSGRVLHHEPIDRKTAGDILAVGKEHNWYMQAYVNDHLLVPERNERTRLYEKNCGVTAEVLGDDFWHLSAEPDKILVFDYDPKVQKEAEDILTKMFAGRAGHVKSKPEFFEMHRLGISKGRALESLCLQWGIPASHVMTFGNSENDVSMLAMTPWSFAVDNAVPCAKEAARHGTDSNNDDGVAKAVARYVLGE